MSNELSRISSINLPELHDEAQPFSASLILTTGSTQPLSAASLRTLGDLMKLAKARYPSQELPPGTADMYMAEWEDMVVTFGRREGRHDEAVGLARFADALKRTLRDRDRPQFFPAPEEIEMRIRESLRERTERQKTLDELAALDAAKARWERERAEDRAAQEASKAAAAAAVIALCIAAISLQGCKGLRGESIADCLPLGPARGALSQTWAVGKPPSGLTPGNYIVTLTDGEAELAGVSIGGSETLLTIPVPAAEMPAGGVGISTVQIDGQWQYLDCPALAK